MFWIQKIIISFSVYPPQICTTDYPKYIVSSQEEESISIRRVKPLQEKDVLKLHVLFFESKKEGKYQESIQSSTTPDPGYQWESDNF